MSPLPDEVFVNWIGMFEQLLLPVILKEAVGGGTIAIVTELSSVQPKDEVTVSV